MSYRFTQRSFIGLREEMISFMKERLGDEWTDISEADDTMTFIELLATLGDQIHFYIDNQKREADLVTANLPRNVYARSIRDGYTPHLYRAGTTNLNFSIEDENGNIAQLTKDVVIPRYTEIRSKTGETCITAEQAILKAGSTTYSIKFISGSYASETFNRADITKMNYLVLDSDSIATGTESLIYKDNEWTRVDDVYTSYKIKNIFAVQPYFVRNTIKMIVQLPLNWSETINDSSEIKIGFVITNGERSNYPSGTFNDADIDDTLFTTSGDIFDDLGLRIKITQPQAFVNGADAETIESIKKNYINSTRKINSLCTLKDYDSYVKLNFSPNVIVADWNYFPDSYVRFCYPKMASAKREPSAGNSLSIYEEIPPSEAGKIKPFWQPPVDGKFPEGNLDTFKKIDARQVVVFIREKVETSMFKEKYGTSLWYQEWLEKSEGKKYGIQYTFDTKEYERYKQYKETPLGHQGEMYFPWDVVFGRVIDLYEKLLTHQGRGDEICIVPFDYEEFSIDAHIYLTEQVTSVVEVFETIYSQLTAKYDTIENAMKTIYASEIISIMQKASPFVAFVATPKIHEYTEEYALSQKAIDANDTPEAKKIVDDYFNKKINEFNELAYKTWCENTDNPPTPQEKAEKESFIEGVDSGLTFEEWYAIKDPKPSDDQQTAFKAGYKFHDDFIKAQNKYYLEADALRPVPRYWLHFDPPTKEIPNKSLEQIKILGKVRLRLQILGDLNLVQIERNAQSPADSYRYYELQEQIF